MKRQELYEELDTLDLTDEEKKLMRLSIQKIRQLNMTKEQIYDSAMEFAENGCPKLSEYFMNEAIRRGLVLEKNAN